MSTFCSTTSGRPDDDKVSRRAGGAVTDPRSIGLYGSFLVQQRTLEIGVRVALGAGLRLATVGIAVGMALAVPVGLGLQSCL